MKKFIHALYSVIRTKVRQINSINNPLRYIVFKLSIALYHKAHILLEHIKKLHEKSIISKAIDWLGKPYPDAF